MHLMNDDQSLATASDTFFGRHYLIGTLRAHMNLEAQGLVSGN